MVAQDLLFGLNRNEWFQIIAVLLSPVIAIQVEKFLEKRRATKNRKIEIFKTLMATRGSTISFDHVAALNRIDLEFTGKKYKKVIDAWKDYFDLLGQKFDESSFTVWSEKTGDYLTTMLFEMSQALGYDTFDKVTIRRKVYAPSAHVKEQAQNQQIKDLLVKVLSGENALAMDVASAESESNSEYVKNQLEIQKITLENIANGNPWNVKIVKDEE